MRHTMFTLSQSYDYVLYLPFYKPWRSDIYKMAAVSSVDEIFVNG